MTRDLTLELKALRLHGMAGAWAELQEQGRNAQSYCQSPHNPRVLIVCLGVALRMTFDLVASSLMIRPVSQIVSIGERNKCALQRHNLQTMTSQLQLLYHLRSQETDQIGGDEKFESRINFLGDGGTAHGPPASASARTSSTNPPANAPNARAATRPKPPTPDPAVA